MKLLTKMTLFGLVVLTGLQLTSFKTVNSDDQNQVIFLRPQRGMGQGIEHVLMINGEEIGRLTNSSMLTYTLEEQGEYELLVKMLLLNAPAGTPFAEKIKVKPGVPVYVNLKVTYVEIAEVVEEKKALKVMKKCSYKTEKSEAGQ